MHRLGFARTQSDVDDGLREDSVRAYIDPVANRRSNLDIMINSQATRVLFDDQNNAIGVQYINLISDDMNPITVYANKEVILAAGAIGTPKILMLSGIGHKEHLQQMEIPVISDLPVGDNLQDHYGTYGLNWQVDQSLFGTVISGSVSEILTRDSAGLAAMIDYTGFINTLNGPNDPKDTPDIQTIAMAGVSLVSDFGLRIRKQAFNIRDDVWQETFANYVADAFTSTFVYVLLMHPKSRGFVRLASTNPLDLPLVDPNYLQHSDDVATLVRGMRVMIDLFNSPALRNLNPKLLNITIPGCPYPADPENDGYLECIARSFTQTIYHYAGTCRMGDPQDRRSVVDPLLRVIGVNRLRVVDTSVFPKMPSGNPQATAYMLAEKAADIIRGQHVMK
jgi:choline dehydrogenase